MKDEIIGKKFLIVENLHMKRLDSWIDFHYQFLFECKNRKIYVEFLLPVEPCNLVKEKLKDVNFNYEVLEKWRKKTEPKKTNNIALALNVFKKLKNKKFDLVAFHFCMEQTVIIIAIFSRILFNKPILIWHQHDEISSANSRFSIKKYISRLKMLSPLIDKICPVYKGQEEVLLSRGIPLSKITTIYNGVDVGRFNKPINKEMFLEELGIKNGYFIVSTIASLIPRKGIEYFLEAAETIIRAKPKTMFLITGDGSLRDTLKLKSVKLGIANNVLFLGTRSDAHNILSITDIFVLAALSEAFVLVNIEAMAAGKPIVATNVGGTPEMVRDNVNGFLVPPRNAEALSGAILELLNNRDLARKMGEKGREIVELEFSVNKMVENYLSVYKKCL